jgi:putative aminopeptidase FrvX
MEQTIRLLQELTRLPGIPGREEAVAQYLIDYPLQDKTSNRIDGSGNAWIECAGPAGPPVIFAAHTDEVGFRVKRIEPDGRVSIIGHERTDLRTLGSEVVRIWTEKGPVPAFLCNGQETTLPRDYSTLNPDNVHLELGVTSGKAAAKFGIQPGDPVTYDPSFHRLAGKICCAKAFDNRSSLAAILRGLELSRGKRKQRPIFIGTSQEEIGGFGADSVEFPERPRAVLVLDICGGEVFGLPQPDRRTILGQGPILLDHPGTHRGLLLRLVALAQRAKIPYQRMATFSRGADPSLLQKKCGGLPMVAIILPMSYYHGPRGLIHAGDVHAAARLVAAVLGDGKLLGAKA